jgi:hypothetical protein
MWCVEEEMQPRDEAKEKERRRMGVSPMQMGSDSKARRRL